MTVKVPEIVCAMEIVATVVSKEVSTCVTDFKASAGKAVMVISTLYSLHDFPKY